MQQEQALVPLVPSLTGATSALGTCGLALVTRPFQGRLEPEVLRGAEGVDAEEGSEAGGIEASSEDAVESVATLQPSGRKSQAVLVLGAGIPGVSGEENMSGPPTSWALAKEPGVVTLGVRPGL
jgi:hypothetical protein